MNGIIATLTRRYSRRALVKPNFTYLFWRFVGNGLRTVRALGGSLSHRDVPVIARELRQQGIVVGPAATFLSGDGAVALRDAAARILRTSRRADMEALVTGGAAAAVERQKDFLVHLVAYPDGVPPDDPLLTVALDRKLLEIVSSYFGFWPCLHSIGAWLNYPTEAPPQISQLWHRDPEDLRIVKAFIYLADVDDQCGPFTYIPRTHPFGAEAANAWRLAKKKRVEDDRLSRVFPPESWRACTGPAETMILADTVGFHRGGKPTAGRRILITFTYTSATPMVERPIRVTRVPEWATARIQRLAVEPLLKNGDPGEAPPHRKKRK